MVGTDPFPRTELTKKLWEYIREHGLQDTINKRNIHADEKLLAVFDGKPVVSMFEMTEVGERASRLEVTHRINVVGALGAGGCLLVRGFGGGRGFVVPRFSACRRRSFSLTQ